MKMRHICAIKGNGPDFVSFKRRCNCAVIFAVRPQMSLAAVTRSGRFGYQHSHLTHGHKHAGMHLYTFPKSAANDAASSTNNELIPEH